MADLSKLLDVGFEELLNPSIYEFFNVHRNHRSTVGCDVIPGIGTPIVYQTIGSVILLE